MSNVNQLLTRDMCDTLKYFLTILRKIPAINNQLFQLNIEKSNFHRHLYIYIFKKYKMKNFSIYIIIFSIELRQI